MHLVIWVHVDHRRLELFDAAHFLGISNCTNGFHIHYQLLEADIAITSRSGSGLPDSPKKTEQF